MATQLDYLCSEYSPKHVAGLVGVYDRVIGFLFSKRGKSLPEYVKSISDHSFVVHENVIKLGDDVCTNVFDESHGTTSKKIKENSFIVTTTHNNFEFVRHHLWHDIDGMIREKKIQAMEEYTGGDAVLNHYIAILLRAKEQGIKKFYSDISLSPGTIKIYERLKGLGRNIYGPCESIDSIDSSGTVKSKKPIYYIELQKSHEN